MILKCSSQIQEERTAGAIYHLLTGKRSIQTVQDAYIYQIDQFYGVCDQLNKVSFEQVLQELSQQNLLLLTTESTCKTTTKGIKWLSEKQHQLQFTYFNGLTYHAIDRVFFERLLLFIQVLTNKKMNHSSFIPIVDKGRITNWMKTFYQMIKVDIDVYVTMIYKELSFSLQNFPKQEAEMFVDRLTGYQHYGMSVYQLANRYQLSEDDVRLLFTGITHRMLNIIQKDAAKYPLLMKVISDLRTEGFLTHSAHKTYELIKDGYTTEEIAKIRKLKVNTIYDHIVEVSLYDESFSIVPYVSQKTQLEIINALKQTKSSKLRTIKEKVHDDITYFQIRLVLAFIKGDRYEST